MSVLSNLCWLVGWCGRVVGYGLVWVRLGLGGFGWASDKTPLGWARSSDAEASSHANGPDFPPAWSGVISGDTNFHWSWTRGDAPRPRAEPRTYRVLGSSPSAPTKRP